MGAHSVNGSKASAAFASLEALGSGEVATLRFPAGDGEFEAPSLTFARANENIATIAPHATAPGISFLGRPSPNPARGPATIAMSISAADANSRTHVQVMDVSGRNVRLLSTAPLAAGQHTLTWDLTRDDGTAARPVSTSCAPAWARHPHPAPDRRPLTRAHRERTAP